MAGKFEDVQVVKKVTKKIEGLFQQKGSYASEFYFSSNKDFNKTINKNLTEKLLKDFDAYILDPINRILVVFFIYNKKGDAYFERLYYFNPEGWTPPKKIKSTHLENLTKIIIRDYEIFLSENKKIKSFEIGLHFYPV
jgi:hypothetical protein